MNLTIDQFLSSVERSVRELPTVVREWHSIDDDLQQEYADQLSWLLGSYAEVMAMAATQGRLSEVEQRLATANAALLDYRDALNDLMGVSLVAHATAS